MWSLSVNYTNIILFHYFRDKWNHISVKISDDTELNLQLTDSQTVWFGQDWTYTFTNYLQIIIWCKNILLQGCQVCD